MSVGKVICHIEDVSSRPLYLISLNEGSPYTSHAPVSYDIFLTASQFDGIKLWDLRTNKHVLSYKEHRCRSFHCGASFTPCGKYIAAGSEDKSVYIYDLRQLSHAHKFSDQQTDVFTSVAFTPKSQMLASSSNGMVYYYGEND
ncbi:hypothetical protein JTE90_018377 [Oedothorax gibbosus]|uniref:Uncharacterized protein n=1 Tax=Oedothorax gibbosus TaxID=931172 RepID=A0AAV6UDJ0_9ARAC|nr:hypothetical protein JTE90_018377 [Oedothorax gibbosus]